MSVKSCYNSTKSSLEVIFLLLQPAVRQLKVQLHVVKYPVIYGEEPFFYGPFNYRFKMLLNFSNIFWLLNHTPLYCFSSLLMYYC